jgi:hypothetical protein
MGLHGYARSFATVLIALAAVACGNSGSGRPDAGPPADGPTQAPDFSVADSPITVTVDVGFEYASLAGFFADGPPITHHVPAETEGSCRIIRSPERFLARRLDPLTLWASHKFVDIGLAKELA